MAPAMVSVPESVIAPAASSRAVPPIWAAARSIAAPSNTETLPAAVAVPAASSVRRLSAPKVDPVSSRVIAAPASTRVVKLAAPPMESTPQSAMAPPAVTCRLPEIDSAGRSIAWASK